MGTEPKIGLKGRLRYGRLLAVVLVLGISGVLLAQEASKPTLSGFTPRRTMLPEKQPKTEQQVESFIDSLSPTDGMFEVIVGQGRLLTLKEDIAVAGKPSPLIAMGDPSVVDFEIVGPRHIRLTGRRIGITDLSILTADRQQYAFEVHVVANLDLLRARLRETFPDALLKLAQIRDHIVVEGQARDSRQVVQIIKTIKVYLLSIQTAQATKVTEKNRRGGPGAGRGGPNNGEGEEDDANAGQVDAEHEKPDVTAKIPPPEVINLIRVPGPQQVMLKVQIAELNRTSLRQLGSSFLFQDAKSAFGHNIGGGIPGSTAAANPALAFARLLNPLDAGTTAFGVFNGGNFNYFLNALRRNQVLKVLAEPNLVVMNGHEASFLAGGEFPVPVPQSGAGGGAATITIQYKKFGVSLKFLPIIIDGETIRLSVSPQVSSIDEELGISLQGFLVPALNTQEVSTVVELKEGQTLAIAGLLQVEMAGNTDRIPGLGSLPYIGAMFSNTSSRAVEKELIILVTPYLVDAMKADEVPALPGAEVQAPDDFEVYLLGRIEGRTGCEFRPTLSWDHNRKSSHRLRLDDAYISGPHGYSKF
jgi:pilus assembly protein CpaC